MAHSTPILFLGRFEPSGARGRMLSVAWALSVISSLVKLLCGIYCLTCPLTSNSLILRYFARSPIYAAPHFDALSLSPRIARLHKSLSLLFSSSSNAERLRFSYVFSRGHLTYMRSSIRDPIYAGPESLINLLKSARSACHDADWSRVNCATFPGAARSSLIRDSFLVPFNTVTFPRAMTRL